MELTPHVEAIRAALRSVAGDDEASAAAAERLSAALEATLQLQVLDMLGQVALELGDQLPTGRVELRLAGRDVQLIYTHAENEAAPTGDDDGTTARLTLRMSEGLKSAVEGAAAKQGVSTNAWLVVAVRRAIEQPTARQRSSGKRLTGYAQG
ncbi:MAG: histidine kinase [Candidatus Nanopelagicales bacterium]